MSRGSRRPSRIALLLRPKSFAPCCGRTNPHWSKSSSKRSFGGRIGRDGWNCALVSGVISRIPFRSVSLVWRSCARGAAAVARWMPVPRNWSPPDICTTMPACGGHRSGFTALVCRGGMARDFSSITSSMRMPRVTPFHGAGLRGCKRLEKPTSFGAPTWPPTGLMRLQMVWRCWIVAGTRNSSGITGCCARGAASPRGGSLTRVRADG